MALLRKAKIHGWRRNYPMPGKPDFVFLKAKLAVFVDGCFWHACPEHGSRPANNVWYWEPKLRKNVERDRAADAALSAAGWDVVRVWEHEPLDAAVTAVLAALSGSRSPGTRPERDRSALDRTAARARPAPAEEPGPSADVPPGQ